MKPLLLLSALVAVSASPAFAQPYYSEVEANPGYDDGIVYSRPSRPLLPPRPVPVVEEPRGTVVTTTRRVVVPPDEFGVATTRTVTTTRRIVREPGGPFPVYGEPGIVARPLPAIRPVVTKDPYDPPRLGGYYGAAPRVVARPPLVVEERRVETTRRYVAPDDVDLED